RSSVPRRAWIVVMLSHSRFRRRLEPLLQLFGRDDSGLLASQVAMVKDGEVGNTAHVVTGSQLRNALGIDLQYYGFPGHLPGSASHFRSRHPARSTPCSPEVNQHRHTGLAHDLVELGCIDLDWFTRGW